MADLTGINILIVEDEEMLLELMIEEFQAAGAFVLASTTGSEALEKFKQNHFHALITDIHIPDGNGNWLVEEVCKMTENPPAIFLCSGVEFSYETEDCPHICAVFRKPIKISEILREVKRFFS
ncbi:MAG: response regulator [Deltaproteobacteria bacterium]|nr:MAG: response regulator [Deltaproteobacteria bacterium]TNF24756.1 MAG: response regulator [Deltaproteobacteria bacterium]